MWSFIVGLLTEDKQMIKIKDIPFLQKIFNKMKGYKIRALDKYIDITGSENLIKISEGAPWEILYSNW